MPALKGDSSRARPVGDAARGESGGIGSIASGSAARRPYSNQRCGFRVAKAGGVIKRLIALCLSQPLSNNGLPPSIRCKRIDGGSQPALKGEVDFAKQKPEGLKKERGFACYRQPLSQTFGLPAPRKGEPYGERISPCTSARRVAQNLIATPSPHPCATRKNPAV